MKEIHDAERVGVLDQCVWLLLNNIGVIDATPIHGL